MTAPPAVRRPAGRPPKIRNRARWGLYVDAEAKRRGEARAAEKGHGDYTDVLRTLMAAYAAGHLDSFVTYPPRSPAETGTPAPEANGRRRGTAGRP